MSSTGKKRIVIKKKSKKFISYPHQNNVNLEHKLAQKKEFFELMPKDNEFNNLQQSRYFKYRNYQTWIKRYMSIDSPYNGILLMHEVGTGKTCTALLFTDSFKKILQKFKNRAVYLTKSSLIESVYGEIFNLEKDATKKKKIDHVQCLGNQYRLSDEYKIHTKVEKQRMIKKKIKQYYKIIGYEKFAREIAKTVGWNGSSDTLTDEIKHKINIAYSNRIFVMDEVHNIKTSGEIDKKLVPPIIETLVRYTSNTKLLLMSATPMYDNPREIIFYINLLRLNDGHEKITESDFFDRNDYLYKTKIPEFSNLVKGYVSFVRGKKPPIFPITITSPRSVSVKMNYAIDGSPILDENNINYLQLIPCHMTETQFGYYSSLIDAKRNNLEEIINDTIYDEDATGISSLVQTSNIALWNKHNNLILGEKGFVGTGKDGSSAFYINRIPGTKRYNFKIQNHLIHNRGTRNERPFLDIDFIKEHSSKLYELYNNIKKSKGVIYIYTEYKYYGAIMIALFLEYMGFERYTISKEYPLLDYGKNNSGGGGKRERLDYEKLEPITKIKSRKPQFAKYVLLSGSVKNYDLVKITPKKVADALNAPDNIDGQKIRVVIGTRISGEGLDLKRIRQIHILEPWYNLSRIEQIEGRGVRQFSHLQLPPNERNIELFKYVSLPPQVSQNSIETIDYRIYRIAELKDRKIKFVEKILKESAVDCYFWSKYNHYGNDKQKSIKQTLSSGKNVVIPWGDQPYSRRCHYENECTITCRSKVKNTGLGKNNSTYPDSELIEQVKQQIHALFIKDFQFTRETIQNYVKQSYPHIDILYVVLALDSIMQKRDILYDVFDRECRLDYHEPYYYLLPIEMEGISTKNIARYYRDRPLPKYDSSVSINKLSNKEIQQVRLVNKNENNDNRMFKEFELNIKNTIILFSGFAKKYTSKFKLTENNIIETSIRNNIDNYNPKNLLQLLDSLLKKNGGKYKLTIYKNILATNKTLRYFNHFWIYKFNGETNVYQWSRKTNQLIIVDNDVKRQILRNLPKITLPSEKYSEYYGYMSVIKNRNVFKIVYQKGDVKTLTLESKKSKRSEVRGRVCSTYKVDDLLAFFDKINGIRGDRINRSKLCSEINFLLRIYQMKNKDNLIWFYHE